MSTPHQAPSPAVNGDHAQRVTTVIACPGVKPMGRPDVSGKTLYVANENHWFDRAGYSRRLKANVAAGLLALGLLGAGIWIVTEFVRLQRIEACFEAGRRDCMPLDMSRKGR